MEVITPYMKNYVLPLCKLTHQLIKYLMINPCKNFTDTAFLLQSLIQENHTAFTCLYQRCKQTCLPYAKARTQLAEEVLEDMLQDALTEFTIQLRNRQYAYQGVPPEQYVKRIYWFKCVNYWRRNGHLEPLPDEDSLLENWPVDDSEESAERESLINRVLQSLTRLDENCLKLVRMFYYQNKPLVECGQELGITAESAKVKRFRCIEKLRNFVL